MATSYTNKVKGNVKYSWETNVLIRTSFLNSIYHSFFKGVLTFSLVSF
jgi:hypothetical protein